MTDWQEERKRKKTERRALVKRILTTLPRPNCAHCGDPLSVYRWATTEYQDWFGYHGNGVFCSAGCGFRFALRAHADGYRIGHTP